MSFLFNDYKLQTKETKTIHNHCAHYMTFVLNTLEDQYRDTKSLIFIKSIKSYASLRKHYFITYHIHCIPSYENKYFSTKKLRTDIKTQSNKTVFNKGHLNFLLLF